MYSKEELYVMIFDIYIKKIGFTPNLVTRLEDILTIGFSRDTLGEVGGSVFNIVNNEGVREIKFEVVRSSLHQKVENALLDFEKGIYSGVKELYKFAKMAKNAQERHHGKKQNLRSICYFFDVACTKPDKLDLLSANGRKFWGNGYRELLKSYVITPSSELKIDEKGFFGLFHLHDNGSEPSHLDVHENMDNHLPNLVISATPDYKTSGIKLHLVHSGFFETLYEGLLKVKD